MVHLLFHCLIVKVHLHGHCLVSTAHNKVLALDILQFGIHLFISWYVFLTF